MAEATLDPTTGTPPATAGNGDSTATEPGPEPGSPSPPPPPLWQRLGHASEEDLVQSHTRYKQMAQGSLTETQRLQREIALRDGRLAELERAPSRRDVSETTSPTPTYSNQQAAYEAYLDGKTDALVVYEREKNTRDEQFVLHTIQRTIGETLQQATLPAQIIHPIIEEYPALRDLSTPLYKFVWDHYDEYAARPYVRSAMDQRPAAIQNGRDPSGSGATKAIDMRVAYLLAKDFDIQQAKEAGRREEAQARSATGSAATGTRRAAPDTEPPAWDQLSASEQRMINNFVAQNIVPNGWPKVADPSKRRAAFAKHFLSRRPAKESEG